MPTVDRDLSYLSKRLESSRQELENAVGTAALAPDIAETAALYAKHLMKYRLAVAGAFVPAEMLRRLQHCEICEKRCPGITVCREVLAA